MRGVILIVIALLAALSCKHDGWWRGLNYCEEDGEPQHQSNCAEEQRDVKVRTDAAICGSPLETDDLLRLVRQALAP